MTKASEIYTLYLKAHHLPADGSVREATIEQAEPTTIHPRPGQTKRVIILSFVGKAHKLILTQGNANRMVMIAGDDLAGWPGMVIGLRADMWGDKPTVIIVPVANQPAKK